MASFDDQLDELGEDFGWLNTPSFIRHKYKELDNQWKALVAPYRSIGAGTATPPDKLVANYRAWQRVYQEYEDSWFNTLFASGAISIWKDEAQRYSRTYDYLLQMYNLNAGPNQGLTPNPQASGASEPRTLILPPEPGSNNSPNTSSGDNSLFAGINWNIGTIAIVSVAGLFAYNIFFRLREGHKERR